MANSLSSSEICRPLCPTCASTQVVRNGHNNGRQRYLCRRCNVSFIYPSVQPQVRLVTQHSEFLATAYQPYTLRHIAHTLGISVGTAFLWRHKYLQNLASPQVTTFFAPGKGAIEITPIYEGKEPDYEAKERDYEGGESDCERNEPGSPPPTTVRKSPRCARFSSFPTDLDCETRSWLVHLVQPNKAPITLQKYDWPTGFSVQKWLQELGVPGTQISTPFGELHLHTTHADANTSLSMESKVDGLSTITANCTQDAPLPIHSHWRFPYCSSKPPCVLVKQDDQSAIPLNKLAEAVQYGFRRWMKQWRGIALKYLNRYIAWYNAVCQHTFNTGAAAANTARSNMLLSIQLAIGLPKAA